MEMCKGGKYPIWRGQRVKLLFTSSYKETGDTLSTPAEVIHLSLHWFVVTINYPLHWNSWHLRVHTNMFIALQFHESSAFARQYLVLHKFHQAQYESVKKAIVLTRVKKSVNKRTAGIRSSVGREPSKENS